MCEFGMCVCVYVCVCVLVCLSIQWPSQESCWTVSLLSNHTPPPPHLSPPPSYFTLPLPPPFLPPPHPPAAHLSSMHLLFVDSRTLTPLVIGLTEQASVIWSSLNCMPMSCHLFPINQGPGYLGDPTWVKKYTSFQLSYLADDVGSWLCRGLCVEWRMHYTPW